MTYYMYITQGMWSLTELLTCLVFITEFWAKKGMNLMVNNWLLHSRLVLILTNRVQFEVRTKFIPWYTRQKNNTNFETYACQRSNKCLAVFQVAKKTKKDSGNVEVKKQILDAVGAKFFSRLLKTSTVFCII